MHFSGLKMTIIGSIDRGPTNIKYHIVRPLSLKLRFDAINILYATLALVEDKILSILDIDL